MTFNSRRRAPAVKLKVRDLLEGEFVTNSDGSKALHVKTDDLLRRARIMGTITSKTVVESEESVILEITDNTGTMPAKAGGSNWSSDVYLELRELKEGVLADVVGLIREGIEGQIYLDVELCLPVKDQSFAVLRDLEITKYYVRKGLASMASEELETAIKGQASLSKSDEIKDQILALLRKDEHLEEGCTFDEIKRALGLTTKELEPELRALQSDGEIFEPIPGTFKYV